MILTLILHQIQSALEKSTSLPDQYTNVPHLASQVELQHAQGQLLAVPEILMYLKYGVI
jgi:hypothetical protein